MLVRCVIRVFKRSLLVLMFNAPSFSTVRAQDAAGFANLFGGLLGAAMVEQNREQWRRLKPDDQACISRGLAQQGSSLQQVIASGIQPSDARLASIRSTCASIVGRQLRQNVECSINTPTGTFISRCNEDFASTVSGENIRVARTEALRSAFSDQPVTTALFERTDAIARRQQMIASGIYSGIVASPNFDCSKAESATAIAICQSNTLASLDAEYGSLYLRLLEADRKPAIIKQARKFLDERNACGGAAECIRQNLVGSLEYMARLARKRGVEVTTSIEQAKKVADAERVRVAAEQRQTSEAEKLEADRRANEQRRLAEAEQQEVQRQTDRQRQAAEAAKQEAEQRAKQKAMSEATKTMIEEASDFLKADPKNNNMLAIAEAIASANAALQADDMTAIERAMDELRHAYRDDAAFPRYLSARADKKSRENARLMADALKLGEQQRRFLESYIAQNPTSPAAAAEISQVKRLADLIAKPDLHLLQDASTAVANDLRRFDLQDNFLLSLNAVDDKVHAAPGTGGIADLGTTTTDKNRFLFNGAPGDLIVMYTAAPSAPHVVKNLRGDIVFDQQAAAACIYQKQSTTALRDRLQTALAKYNIKQLLIDAQPCTADAILSVDVIAVERGVFLRQEPVYAATLLKEIEVDHIKPLLAVTESQADASLESAEAQRRRLQEDIQHGTLSGFALVLLPASQDGPTCGSIPAGDVEAHQAILSRLADPTAARVVKHLKLEYRSVDDVFTSIQRSQCAAVYANGGDLQAMLEAFGRERIRFQLVPTPVLAAQLETEKHRMAAEETAAERDALARERQAQEARKLQSQREQDAASTKAARQAALREKYGKVATAYAAQIAEEVKAYVNASGVVREGKPGAEVPSSFPTLANWFDEKLKDHWELQSADADLEDYGSADWKGREVEIALTTVRLRLKNRALGEYQDGCFAVGQLIDHEFRVTRDPIDVPCGDQAALRSWKQAHNLTSKWTVE